MHQYVNTEQYIDCPYVWYHNIHSTLFGFVTRHACVRWTDRQNCDFKDCASIAASRGEN